MTVRFEHETRIEAPVGLVFDLSLDIDAHRASMSASNERAIAGVTSGTIRLGETVTWRATHFRIPFTLTSRVTELERPHRFVDEQVRGPFRSFHHEHLFEALDGATRMIDHIRFDAPIRPIGWLVERAVLASYLQKLIAVRGGYLKAEAERRSRAADPPR
ncbi:MAG: SRPBCC family protein [Acidimicrobiales bacterium]|jgi:ligand-binding SRPBCC domain-containing protein